jgi:poly-beta-1,6-N-acetyl-D-glucosamine synthase
MSEFFQAVQHSTVYWVVLMFFAGYPVVLSIVWMTTGLQFFWRREGRQKPDEEKPQVLERYPMVSVLIPAFCEEALIGEMIEAATKIDYPNYEVVVVDDASTDRTAEIVSPYVQRGKVRLLSKDVNEGKAMAMNDAMPCLNGEIVLIMDADGSPDPQILRWIVPHFESARVAGVTGNPRVANRDTFLSRLQVVEFTSIVSLLRRAQRIWGRIVTMSGVVSAFRKAALIDVKLFSPEMATEDIDMTWSLQSAYYDVRYEPRAIIWMRVPSGLRSLWKQRWRWALGLAQVLRRHGSVMRKWKKRRMWPVFWESVLSISWAYCFVILTTFWLISYFVLHIPPVGVTPIPNWWGMTIGTLSLAQLVTGVMLDSRYDRDARRHLPMAVAYPIIYWMMMSVITVLITPKGLLFKARRGSVTQWRTTR